MPRHKTFIFGAGASKAENAPLTSELLFEALRDPSGDRRFVCVVEHFLADFFGIRNTNTIDSAKKLPSFEELLTLVDMAVLKQEGFSAHWNKTRLAVLQEALIYCMAEILKRKLQLRPETIPAYHKQFLENILSRGKDALLSSSFISLNYDILLDDALLNLYPNIDVDYAANFRNFRNPRSKRKIKLLKLHGSLNWMFCPVCRSMKLNLEGKIADKVIAKKIPCERDGAAQRPLVIAPTWLKVYDNPHLMGIWLEAENTLRNTDEVFFVGYSLPDSDVHVRYLLKKSLYRKSTAPRIVVVTSTENGEGSELHMRYKRFFGEVEHYPIGFEIFSQNVGSYL